MIAASRGFQHFDQNMVLAQNLNGNDIPIFLSLGRGPLDFVLAIRRQSDGRVAKQVVAPTLPMSLRPVIEFTPRAPFA